ncbi:GHMP family kinase ATP-binding protein [Aliivibrio fischeri]|uniref:GHMP kinase N-terminal domain-containing protein n=1 Tax=Aliivibrio fischeri TaxID=668 RepID=A0A510UR77_ALIFS|nr:hypothetical protein [Aliivibrio fischeri]GEK15720.1 hypothetical protein AFI02nite_37560 [Aliivibrio fischeri]
MELIDKKDNCIISKSHTYDEIKYVCRGSLGELYQGPLFSKNTMDIGIISAISDNYTIAKFTPNKKCNLTKLGKIKVKKAIEAYFQKFGETKIEGEWFFESDCIVGAGMSSSTSDIVSALNCINSVLGRILTIKDLCDIIRGIERSDSIFIQFPSLYLSQKQAIVDIYYPPNPIYCLYILESDLVDTSETSELLLNHYSNYESNYKYLLDRVQCAFKNKNTTEIIQCSTESAKLSQIVLPKKNFNYIYDNYKKIGADGLIVAHTGSLIGFLYKNSIKFEQLNNARNLFTKLGFKMNKGTIFNV